MSESVGLTRPGAYTIVPNDDEKLVPGEYVGHPIAPNYYCRGWNGKRKKYCRARAGSGTDHPGEGRCNMHGGTRKVKHGLTRRYKLTKSPSLAEMIARHADAENPLDISGEIALLRALTETWLNEKGELLEQLSAWHAQRKLDPDQQNAMYQLIDEYEVIVKERDDATVHQIELPRLARAAVKHLGDDIPRPSQVPELTDVVKIIGETTRSVERVFTMRAKMAITFEQLQRFLFVAGRQIEARVRAAVLDPKKADEVVTKIGEDLRAIRP